jgi:HEAT repeat protein
LSESSSTTDVAIATDSRRDNAARMAAVARLGQSDDPRAVAALREVAQDARAPIDVVRAAGAAFATGVIRRGQLRDVDLALALFTGDAYLSFDETVAAWRSRQPPNAH